jgi:hypothetical protein
MYFSAMKGLAGPTPFYFRVVNLALLGIISLMIGKLIIDLSGDRLAAFFGATLYSANAAHALTQHWISCFPELISTFLVVVAFSTYVFWSRKGRAIYLTVSIGSFLLALVSKEIAVALPGLLLLFELLYVEPGEKKEIASVAKKVLPFAIISLLFMLFFMETQTGPYRISAGPFVLKNFALYLFSAVDGYLIGFLSVPPTDTLVRDHSASVVAFWQTCLKFALVVLILAWLSWKQKWDIKREISFSLGWFIMGLGPLLFTPGRFQHYYLLLPNVGLMLLIASIAGKIMRSIADINRTSATIIALIFLGAVLFRSTSVVRNEQEPLLAVSLSMRSMEEQLRSKIPNPPDNSIFILSGDYGANWWRNLPEAMRVIYGNSTLNAVDVRDRDFVNKSSMNASAWYLIHVERGTLYVETP